MPDTQKNDTRATARLVSLWLLNSWLVNITQQSENLDARRAVNEAKKFVLISSRLTQFPEAIDEHAAHKDDMQEYEKTIEARA